MLIQTSHGAIAVTDTGGDGTAILFIHGNSACKEVFSRQFDSDLRASFRLIAFDLPGHGESDDATDPERTYSFEGYADIAAQVMAHRAVSQPIIVGWSLGGHVAIDMLRREPRLRGIVLTGTPPVGAADIEQGFLPHPHMALTSKADFSADDVQAYAAESTGTIEAFLTAAVRRTDGRAREWMIRNALRPGGPNQRTLVERTDVPTAVITGANEPFVNNAYLDTVAWGNLWEARVHRIEGAGHAPFRERPDAFNALLHRFVTNTP